MADKKPNPFANLLARTQEEMAKKAAAAKAAESADVSKSAAEASEASRGQPVTEAQQPESKNPFLVTSAAASIAGTELPSFDSVVDGEISSVNELANLDTEQMGLEPQDSKEWNVEVAEAAKLTKAIILDDAKKVRSLCDEIDSKLTATQSLSGPALFEIRNYVQTLMVTLKEHPEFDSIVLPGDVNNIFRFIRATRHEALMLREVKTEKKVQRQVNKETKQKKTGVDATALSNAFDALFTGFGKS
jgi:hypothetical protein